MVMEDWFLSLVEAFCNMADDTLKALLPGRLSKLLLVFKLIMEE
jgi:hypothetical protein